MFLIGFIGLFIGSYIIIKNNKVFNGLTIVLLAWGSTFGGSILILIKDGNQYVSFITGIAILSLAIGSYLAARLMGFKANKDNKIWNAKVVKKGFPSEFSNLFIAASIICSVCYLAIILNFFASAGREILFSANSRPLLRAMRMAGIPIRSFETALPFLACFYILSYKLRNMRVALIWSSICSLGILFAEIAWASRGGLLFFLIYFALCYSYVQYRHFIKILIIIAFLGFISFLIIHKYTRDPLITSLGSFVEALLDRVFYQQAVGIEWIITGMLPSHLYGLGVLENEFAQLLAFLRLRSYVPNIGVELAKAIFREATLSYNANTMFIGEAYALARTLGVVMSSFAFGFFLQVIHIRILRGRKSPIRIAFISYLSWAFAMLAVGGGLFSHALTRCCFLALVLASIYVVFYVLMAISCFCKVLTKSKY